MNVNNLNVICLIISLFTINSFSQEKYSYEINNTIDVKYISVEKSLGNKYLRYTKKELIGVTLHKLENDICYLRKKYNTDLEDEKFELGEKIDCELFENIVIGLNKINVDEINYDYNIYDGISYNLKFGDNIYSIYLSANTVGEHEHEEKLNNFIKVIYEIWNLANE